jgi:hypothetical protein
MGYWLIKAFSRNETINANVAKGLTIISFGSMEGSWLWLTRPTSPGAHERLGLRAGQTLLTALAVGESDVESQNVPPADTQRDSRVSRLTVKAEDPIGLRDGVPALQIGQFTGMARGYGYETG